jgi:hypothetical protein
MILLRNVRFAKTVNMYETYLLRNGRQRCGIDLEVETLRRMRRLSFAGLFCVPDSFELRVPTCSTSAAGCSVGLFLAASLAIVHYPAILRRNSIDSFDLGPFSWSAIIYPVNYYPYFNDMVTGHHLILPQASG